MVESSACLMRSFSQPSHTSHDYDDGDPLRALTTSISFGRFMTETLDWEKRSAFTQNRNLEEAKKLSKLGSVAQKKAYFEAHYKRIAAKKKAAALLEQDPDAPNHSPELTNDSSVDLEFAKQNSPAAIDQIQVQQSSSTDLVSTMDANEFNPNVEVNKSDASSQPETEQLAYNQNPIRVELLNQTENIKMPEEEKTPVNVKDVAKKEDLASSSKKKPVISSSKSSTCSGVSKPPVKATNVHSKKDDNARELLKKKSSTPKSFHMSINFGSRAGETIKKSSPIIDKIGNSRIVKTFVKASKDSWTQRTPTRASVNGVPKHTLVKPQPEKRRTETQLHCPVSRGKVADGKPPSLSKDRSESSRASCTTKTQSPIVSSSFNFKSEERAAKRKEFFQKLEENAKEAEKVRLKAKSKIPPTRPFSPKPGRKSTLSINQDTNSRPPWKSSVKNDGSKKVTEKNRRTTTHSVNMLPKKNTRENASPNIPL